MPDQVCIWITRPEGQADSLIAALEKQGVAVRQLPMFTITPLEENETIRATVLDLDRYDLLLFISTNAATLGMELIDKYWPQFPVRLPIYCVGPTTAAVIEKFGQKAEYPGQRMSSEALLALDSLTDISGMKALIVRGVGGRELLAAGLREKGAQVDYLELYRREFPQYDAGLVAGYYQADAPEAVVVTSAEALDNFAALLRQEKLAVATIPLFVSSPRIADKALASGFENTVTMPGADDKAIIASLDPILQARNSQNS